MWKVGDLAVVDCPGSALNGEIVTLLAERFDELIVGNQLVGPLQYWEVSHPRPLKSNKGYGFEPHELIPLDGNEKGSWEDCVWKPKELVCVTN